VHAPILATAALLGLAACDKTEPKPEPAPAPAPAPAAPAAGPGDCATLTGANVVQTEMRRLECALQHAIAAIGRDDLPSIPTWIHVVHEARIETEKAIESGAYTVPGDAQAFAALDATFHGELEQLVMAAGAKDHAGATAALGRALAACHGCHATFRPIPPGPPGAATAPAPPAPAHGH
jgi:hypothetical protein